MAMEQWQIRAWRRSDVNDLINEVEDTIINGESYMDDWYTYDQAVRMLPLLKRTYVKLCALSGITMTL